MVPQIIDGFKQDLLNIEKTLYGNKSLGLTDIHMESITKKANTKFGLSVFEVESLRDFFQEEIIGQSTEHILRIYQKLFKDIEYPELQNVLLFKITKFKANDFLFFQKLVGHTVAKTTLEQKLEYLFDIFSDFSGEMR